MSEPRATPRAVAIGNFDGVHRGHLAVLEVLFVAARRLGAVPTVLTFDPAPTAVVAPQRHQPRLQSLEARVASLRTAGVGEVVVEAFTPAYAAQPAEVFVRGVLLEQLSACALVVGHDFRFGNMRAGDAEAIRTLAPALEVLEVGALEEGGAPISSSRVRKALQEGRLAEANALLGRPHTVSGEVVHGDARGRTIGFPTANLALVEELRPAPGVYAVRALRPNGERLRGVANLGFRPTVGGTRYAVEAHLFDFEGDLYGEHLVLSLESRLREERRFGSLPELVAQIRLDAAAARAVLA